MIFKTHELPQEYKPTKSGKILLIISGILLAFLPILGFVALVVETHKFIAPFCLSVLPFLLLGGAWCLILYDMKRAFVEITDDKIVAVDYYFGLKHEKVFFRKDIVSVEITTGYSMRIRGYRFSGTGFPNLKYIVFRGKNKKYLLKLICSNETKSYVEKHFEIVNT